MGQAIGQVLVFAVGVALSPVAIAGVTLLLATPRGRSTAPAFVAGWIGGLAVAGTIFLLLGSGAGASEGGAPADWVSVVKLALGLALLVAAVRRWRSRSLDGEAERAPGWMRAVDRFTPARSASLGLALSAINPKNLLLVVAAAAAIAETGISAGRQAVALVVFVLVGSIGVGAPVALFFAVGERSAGALDSLRARMQHNGAAVTAVLFLLIGAKLIGDGIAGLSG